MSDRPHPVSQIVDQLRALGVKEGDVLLAHTSFRAVRPVDGGPQGLIEALCASVGPAGTLAMPSWSGDFDEPFDPSMSPASPALGVVADIFWRLPGAMRSRTPFAFAARGPGAHDLLSGPLLLPPHQPESPVGKVLSKDGRILLLGLGHDSNTTLHLAELLADVPYKKLTHLTVFGDGAPRRAAYFESRHCFKLFSKADDWMRAAGLQSEGQIGQATARLMRTRDLVDVVVAELRRDPFSFLHPRGTGCAACDEAWRSVGR